MKIILLLTFVFFASCSAPQVRTAPLASARPTDAQADAPACLSISEGDRHVEFNGRELWLAETGQPRPLELDNGGLVTCERLSIVREAARPTVLIQFKTIEKGRAAAGISDRVVALASIKDASWILEPLILERHINAHDGFKLKEKYTFEQNGGTFTITDLATKKSRVIKL